MVLEDPFVKAGWLELEIGVFGIEFGPKDPIIEVLSEAQYLRQLLAECPDPVELLVFGLFLPSYDPLDLLDWGPVHVL